MSKVIAMIPARYAATRFPAKLMQILGDKPVIVHTYQAAVSSHLFDEVYVITDSDIISKTITDYGGKSIMSLDSHESGTDRIAEAARNLEVDVIVNVQGDEPFIQKEPLEKLVRLFDNEQVQVASLMRKMEAPSDAGNPNMVKVVTNKFNKALYFSRSAIPYQREPDSVVDYFLHIGVYAFRKQALLNFTTLPPAPLEQIEKLEQLRFLYNGIEIYMAETGYKNIAIDTPEDLEKAKQFLS
ncbi:MAG TPA: 3-deoxy-manno-octulosonate cytidylyltransferase [Niabella sp.]|nr:3-deoxy-manno-octulosonate cytidylyltransferase [Niabella sp.]HOZ96566.1 3-deoxy-manno-octulosonate cytidylyltransferase [Niabella sp.]HQW13253.1 3-deoxy-manno-octulosonate cytidylyltransferase [Niabella sp.]HQX18707.1 3-deoxy-manno-octulosonate cytidylyltransferase [Niabella sp.]HQX41847.1 3-deoxy-manno-octulosonate cytidylyltransferase [Niabella sp.]